MVVKEGYKNTEVGVIPEDWEVIRFDDLADKNKRWSITGGPFGSDLKTSDYTITGIQVIQLQNIGDGVFIDKSQIYVSEKKANKLIACNIYSGDIILSKMGDPVARACFMPSKSSRYVMASDGIRLVVNEKLFNKKFVHDYINSNFFRNKAFEVSTGSTRLRIGLPKLKSLPVVYPPLPEQTAIATVLSDTDNLIQALEKKIAKKELIKKGAMQQLLKPKEGWEVKTLKDITSFLNGNAHEQFIKEDAEFIVINSKFISTDGKIFKTSTASLCPLKKGDITMVMSDLPNGKALAKCFLVPEDNKYTLNQRICCLRTESVDNVYLSYILNRNKYYLAFDSGTGQTNLKRNDVLECPIWLPPTIEEQTHIAQILSDMDNEIELLQEKLSKYKQVKQGLMQELLTGRIRLV